MSTRTSRRRMLQYGGALLASLTAGCAGGTTDEETNGSQNGNETNDDTGPAETVVTPATGETLDDFEDLSQWNAPAGSLTSTDEETLSGSQSARLTIHEDQTRGVITRDFHPPIDLNAHRPHLAVKADVDVLPWIQLLDIHGNRIDFRSAVRQGVDFQYYNFGLVDVDEDLDLGAIERIQIAANVEDGEQKHLLFDDLRIGGRHKPGIVVLHFDDGLETHYSTAYPILEEHDMVASAFINPGYLGRVVGGSQRMSVNELDELQEAGWDICNHGMYHQNLATLNDEEREKEVNQAHEWLVDHGFDGANYFAYPFTEYDQATLSLVAEHHDLGFSAGWPALGRASSPYLIHRALADPRIEEARAAIDLTATYGGITNIYYHHLTEDLAEATFRETVSHLQERRDEGRIDVKRVSDVGDDYLDDTIS